MGIEGVTDEFGNVYFGRLHLGRFNKRDMRIEDALGGNVDEQCNHVLGPICQSCSRTLAWPSCSTAVSDPARARVWLVRTIFMITSALGPISVRSRTSR